MKIPLFKIASSKHDISAVSKIISSKSSWAAGSVINKFEDEIKKLNKTKYAIAFNSGTSALIAMYLAYDLKNSEIIVPSFTFIATANAVILSNAKLKFCDIEDETYGISFDELKKIITKKTKAVVLMHYSGCPARDTIKIKKLCKQKNILLLEDNAHSYGAKIKEKFAGTFGDSSALSFCQNKLISTGEGGAVVTNNKIVYEKLKLIRSHGRLEKDDQSYFNSLEEFDYIELGYNFRLSSLNAALGISQIKRHFKDNVKKRIKNANYMIKKLSKFKDLTLPVPPRDHDHFYQQFTIRISNFSNSLRNNLQNYLIKNGISARIYYEPIHLKTYYKNLHKKNPIKLPMTEKISNSIITLPIYPDMTFKEIDYIFKQIENFYRNKL